jgi:hypothetical protein
VVPGAPGRHSVALTIVSYREASKHGRGLCAGGTEHRQNGGKERILAIRLMMAELATFVSVVHDDMDLAGFSVCMVCKGRDIKKEKQTLGCRMNGDGYGIENFTCNTCAWKTSFEYDEGGNAYYPQVKSWIPQKMLRNHRSCSDLECDVDICKQQ